MVSNFLKHSSILAFCLFLSLFLSFRDAQARVCFVTDPECGGLPPSTPTPPCTPGYPLTTAPSCGPGQEFKTSAGGNCFTNCDCKPEYNISSDDCPAGCSGTACTINGVTKYSNCNVNTATHTPVANCGSSCSRTGLLNCNGNIGYASCSKGGNILAADCDDGCAKGTEYTCGPDGTVYASCSRGSLIPETNCSETDCEKSTPINCNGANGYSSCNHPTGYLTGCPTGSPSLPALTCNSLDKFPPQACSGGGGTCPTGQWNLGEWCSGAGLWCPI